MGRVAHLVLDALAAEITGRTEWDEAPALCFIYLHEGQCRIGPSVVPDFLWGTDAPPRVLARIADGLGDFSWLLQSAAPEGLHGAAFRCESWAVDSGLPGTERYSETAAAGLARRLHEHPDRVESRCMYAVDRAGTTYAVMQARGENEARRHVAYRKSGRPEVSGTIPDALDRLVTALLGVEMPARARR